MKMNKKEIEFVIKSGEGIRIEFKESFDDRVEISNPGGLIIKEEEFGKRSLSRNPLVFGLMQKADLVEQVGSGINRIREAMKNMELKVPIFDFGKFFAVTLLRPDDNEIDKIVGTYSPQKTFKDVVETWSKRGVNVGETEEKILQQILLNPRVRLVMISQTLKLSRRTIEDAIVRLKEKRLLKRIGPDKGGYWEVSK